jgi:hypothetical protein
MVYDETIELYKVFISQSNQLTEISMADVSMINAPPLRRGRALPNLSEPSWRGRT